MSSTGLAVCTPEGFCCSSYFIPGQFRDCACQCHQDGEYATVGGCVCGPNGTGTRFCDFNDHHAYWRDGTRLDSVTQIIKHCFPRTDNAPEDAIEGARQRGTFVDSAVAEFLATGNVTIPGWAIDKKWDQSVDQAVNWFRKERPGALVETQTRLYGAREAGSTDFIIDREEIIDLKATYDVYPKTQGIQLGGYAELYGEHRGISSDLLGLKLAVLHVNKRYKKAQYRPFEASEVVNQWRWTRDYWRLWNQK